MNFVSEHDSRLRKRAPCFFSLCIPSITSSYKLQIFYHTTARKNKAQGLRYIVVCEDATESYMDEFETNFKALLQDLLLANLIEKLIRQEELMAMPLPQAQFELLISANLTLGQYT